MNDDKTKTSVPDMPAPLPPLSHGTMLRLDISGPIPSDDDALLIKRAICRVLDPYKGLRVVMQLMER